MCSDAVKSELAELRVRLDNPAKDVAAPESGEERAKQFLYPSEFLKLLTCEDVPLRWRRAVVVAICLYPRAGEQRALAWTDIDLEHGMVHIHQAFERRSRTIGSTKSDGAAGSRASPRCCRSSARCTRSREGSARSPSSQTAWRRACATGS